MSHPQRTPPKKPNAVDEDDLVLTHLSIEEDIPPLFHTWRMVVYVSQAVDHTESTASK